MHMEEMGLFLKIKSFQCSSYEVFNPSLYIILCVSASCKEPLESRNLLCEFLVLSTPPSS